MKKYIFINMKRLAVILILIAMKQIVSAQQLPLYSQYLYNKFLINPAHAGSDGYTSFNLTAREQWVGYSGAPRTYSLSWQTRILKKGYQLNKNIFDRTVYRRKTDGKVGLGAYVFSDKNGLIQRTGFQASYSYHMWIQDVTQLSLGLAFTGYHFRINANESSFEDPNEPWLTDNLRRGVFVPDADFGIYLLNPKFDLGFSAQQIFGAAAKIGNYAYRNFRMDRHYYLFGSYNFGRGKTEIEPSILAKVSEQLRPQADIGLTYIYDQSVWTGLAYRTGGGVIANARFKYVPRHTKATAIFIGYALDFTLNQIQRVTYGTHELTVALKFGESSRKYRWLDRY
jgi:type IX secretion system PorP/SprF family membrane protein